MTAAPDEYVDREEIIPLLGQTRRNGSYLMAFCPAHNDGAKHGGKGGESLSLSESGVLMCHAGCSFKDIMAGLRQRALMPEPIPIRRQPEPSERLVKTYQYIDAAGAVVAEKGRFETVDGRKTFRWRLPGVANWPGGVSLAEMPLYGLSALLARTREPVYFVEGEKACDACLAAGLLAVTHGGGAGTKDFGKSLDALRGRAVYLWPDNDAPGAAYMTLILAKLTGIAAEVHYVRTPIALPPKGDAYDYFAHGGKVEQLSAATPYEPVVTILGVDACRVAIPTAGGSVTFDFSEMEKGTRELDVHLVVSCQSSPEPYSERLNIDSKSARNQLRIDLDTIFGKQHEWTLNLNKAINRARETFLSQERSEDVFDMPDPMGETMLLDPFLVLDGATVMFGDGSSGKSYIALTMALCSAYGLDFCGYKTPSMRVLYVDYEDSAANFKRRAGRVAASMGIPAMGVYYWPARGIPLADQWEAIKRSCDRNGIGWIVVDSAAPATGGPPEDAVAALAFFRALKRIGLPVLVIAHITKTGLENTHKPFGSVFWHNEPRRTWYVKRIQEEDSDVIDIGLYCRKVNDGTKPRPIGLRMSFDGKDGPVALELAGLNETPELLSETSAKNQVWEVLGHGPLTVSDISEQTGLLADTVNKTLRRSRDLFIGHGSVPNPTGKGAPQIQWARLRRDY